jgi:hypothetical protein
VIAIWSLRNEELHGTNMTEKVKRKKQILIEELTSIITNNQDLSPSQLDMINIDAGRQSELTLNQLQTHIYGASMVTKMHNQ